MRDEPQILADLIRLLTQAETSGGSKITAADAELIEEARRALHRYVKDAGRKTLAGQVERAPMNWWASLCVSTGFVVGALVYGWPHWPLLVVATCAAAFLSIVALIADWRRK